MSAPWTLRICKWDKFQHYTSRNPPWIKLHRELVDKREWRDLPPRAGKLLVDLWMLAATDENGAIGLKLQDIAWRLRVEMGPMLVDLQLLNGYGFIEIASSALATCEQVAPKSLSETERETEAEGEAEKSNTGADAPETNLAHAYKALLPVIRDKLWPPHGKPTFSDQDGKPWSEARECTVIRQLLRRGHSVPDLLELVSGLAVLRDHNGLYADAVSWLSPGCQISLRVLFKAQSGAMPIVNLARTAFLKHQTRAGKAQGVPSRIEAA